MEINIKNQWGIIDGINKGEAKNNSKKFWDNIENGQTLYLPNGTYEFNMIYLRGKDNVELYGEVDANGNLMTTIRFIPVTQTPGEEQFNQHTFLKLDESDSFNIHDLIFDGREAVYEGGVMSENKDATNGILKNLEIRDAFNVSCVIGGLGTQNVTVEDCTVYGQRGWSGDAKAMFLAGDFAEDITFKNCKTYSKSYYNPTTDYSPADHFDSDNGRNIEYHNCVADGTGTPDTRRGVGFWNEAYNENEYHETSSVYYDCTAIKTDGGLAGTENSDVVAHNFTFIECSYTGWAAWARCCGNFELYDSLFDGCASIDGHGEKRGGIAIEGAPYEKFIKIKRNRFINTPIDDPNYDNISLYSPQFNNGVIEIIDNTFDDNVTAITHSNAENPVYVYWNLFEDFSTLHKNEPSTNYI